MEQRLKIRDLKWYTHSSNYLPSHDSIQCAVFCSCYWVSLYWNTLSWGEGGKCNFYKVFIELKSTLLGYAAVKLLCLAFHLMLLEIFSSAYLKNSVQLLRSVGDPDIGFCKSAPGFLLKTSFLITFHQEINSSIRGKRNMKIEKEENKYILGGTLKF